MSKSRVGVIVGASLVGVVAVMAVGIFATYIAPVVLSILFVVGVLLLAFFFLRKAK